MISKPKRDLIRNERGQGRRWKWSDAQGDTNSDRTFAQLMLSIYFTLLLASLDFENRDVIIVDA